MAEIQRRYRGDTGEIWAESLLHSLPAQSSKVRRPAVPPARRRRSWLVLGLALGLGLGLGVAAPCR